MLRWWLLLCWWSAGLAARADEALYARLYPTADARSEWTRAYSSAEQQRIESLAAVKPAPKELRGVSFHAGGRLLGHAIIDDVRGKHRPITFLLATDAELKIKAVEILAYRESHGGEVRAADWREQFRDKGPGSSLVPGRDIVNIAGATISCRNLTLGVRVRLAALSVGAGSGTPMPIASRTIESQPALRSRLMMGTLLSVEVDASDPALRQRAEEAVFAEIERVDALLSDWREDSTLMRWQAEAREAAVPLDAELARVLEECFALREASAGGFDVGLGALTRLYRAEATPAPQALESARLASGLQALHFDSRTRSARLLHRETRLDFGAFGKGYALRRAAAKLRELGANRALLDFGGQLLALEGRAWPVALAAPFPPRELALQGASIATSSTRERGTHILDPRTGRPAAAAQASLCIAADPALADAWSTALFVLGAAGLELAEAQGVAALLVDADGRTHANPGLLQRFPQLLRP